MYLAGIMFRKYMEKLDGNRLKKIARVSGCEEKKDILYGSEDKYYHLLDIYAKKFDGKIKPVIIDVHGGAYYYGRKIINEDFAKYLAMNGDFYVVNTNYTVIHKGTNLKTQLQDVFTCIDFVYKNADDYGFDLNNIFLTGDSAGGHIVGLIMDIVSSEELQSKLGLTINENIKIKAYGLTCAVYDFEDFKSAWYVRPFLRDILGFSVRNEKEYKNFKVGENLPDMASVFISTCAGDFLKNKNIEFSKILKEKGFDIELYYFDEISKNNVKYEHVYNVLNPLDEESIKVNDRFIQFIKARV